MITHNIPFEEDRELSGRVLDSRPRGGGFKPHRRHCVVVLETEGPRLTGVTALCP